MKKNYLKPDTESVTIKSAWTVCGISPGGDPPDNPPAPGPPGMPRHKGSPIYG